MARKKRRVKKKARRIATFGLISIIAIVAVVITLGSAFFEIVDKYQEKSNLEKKLVALEEKEKELEADVKKLEDPDYLARYAREKYFYSKDGELILRIPEEDK
ncbi:MAG: septum formation initiator family protein [Bacilli bacterium]|nr:septum formation initiator family protein [Bacilli bacterium]